MVKFKAPDNKRKHLSTDGFIVRSNHQSDEQDIRRTFRQSYRPSVDEYRQKGSSLSAEKLHQDQRLDDESAQELDVDGFIPRRAKTFDLNLEATPVKQRRKFLFFGKKQHERKKRQPLRKRLARATGAMALVLLLGAGSILGYGYLKARQIFNGNGQGAAALQENVDPSLLNGEGDGRVNILLLGRGGEGQTAPDLTDTILLASIDPIHNEAALISIPRDMYVQDEVGASSKINAVYSNAKQRKTAQEPNSGQNTIERAGVQALKEVVTDVLGVPVHYYVMVDFKAFQQAIDAVDGITIDIEEPVYDATMAWMNNGSSLIADKGLQTFNGRKALMFARSRYGSARGDFDRTERQRQVIVALQQKVLTLGTFSNPAKVIDLINALGGNVRTDLNGPGELRRLYEIGQEIGSDKFESVGLADPPKIFVTTSNIGGQSVVVPTAGLYQYDEIHSFIRNKIVDGYIRQENARIVILNGTSTPGLATIREKELESYGYNIVGVENAPTSDYAQTRLIDLTGGQKSYTQKYLETRLGVTVAPNDIAGLPTIETADFVIILGSNEAN